MSTEKPVEVVRREENGDIYYFQGDDAGMQSAIRQARQTLPAFIAELSSPVDGTYYLIKAEFSKDGRSEFLWLSELDYFDGLFFATAGNEGLDVDVHDGDRCVVGQERVIDWMVARDGRFRGGFTQKVLRQRATPEDRARIDANLGVVPE